MNTLHETLSSIKIGKKMTHKNLDMFPLVNGRGGEPDYQVLSEALAAGTARVTEVSDSGNVPELMFVNDGDRAVLLLDGEELMGAKQNRILNLTILVPAKTRIKIPVSCVEQGRWAYDSEDFKAANRAHHSEGRATKAASVSLSMRAGRGRMSNQSEVWHSISDKMMSMDVPSRTMAMSDAYDSHSTSIEEYTQAFSASESQLGGVFAINGRVVGMDLFDFPVTLENLLPKLVRSYALDAIDRRRPGARPALRRSASEFLRSIRGSQSESFPGLGEGEDIRFSGGGISGGALAARGRVIHLCAFQMTDPASSDGGDGFARASARMRGHRRRG